MYCDLSYYVFIIVQFISFVISDWFSLKDRDSTKELYYFCRFYVKPRLKVGILVLLNYRHQEELQTLNMGSSVLSKRPPRPHGIIQSRPRSGEVEAAHPDWPCVLFHVSHQHLDWSKGIHSKRWCVCYLVILPIETAMMSQLYELSI